MKERIKAHLKKIGVFKHYMNFKRKLFIEKIERREEHLNAERRIQFYSQFINKESLCFDVGANIGNRTETFVFLGARVIAIEPQESCVRALERRFDNRIEIDMVGLGPTNTIMEMYISNESTISTFSREFIDKTKENKFKNHNWDKKALIPITTLDDLIIKYGKPDFCKIDVEGFEPEVLKGLTVSIPKISFEYAVPELSDNIIKCLDTLNNLSTNYKYNYAIGESMLFQSPEWKTFDEFKSIIQTKDFLESGFGDIYAFIK